jgi:hypothetical protein
VITIATSSSAAHRVPFAPHPRRGTRRSSHWGIIAKAAHASKQLMLHGRRVSAPDPPLDPEPTNPMNTRLTMRKGTTTTMGPIFPFPRGMGRAATARACMMPLAMQEEVIRITGKGAPKEAFPGSATFARGIEPVRRV